MHPLSAVRSWTTCSTSTPRRTTRPSSPRSKVPQSASSTPASPRRATVCVTSRPPTPCAISTNSGLHSATTSSRTSVFRTAPTSVVCTRPRIPITFGRWCWTEHWIRPSRRKMFRFSNPRDSTRRCRRSSRGARNAHRARFIRVAIHERPTRRWRSGSMSTRSPMVTRSSVRPSSTSEWPRCCTAAKLRDTARSPVGLRSRERQG